MKSCGIVRKIDRLGRIVLPKELRDVLDLDVGTPLEIYSDNEVIALKKYEPTCIFCNESTDVIEYKSKKICKKCVKEIGVIK